MWCAVNNNSKRNHSSLPEANVERLDSFLRNPILVMAKSSAKTVWYMQELMNNRLLLLILRQRIVLL